MSNLSIFSESRRIAGKFISQPVKYSKVLLTFIDVLGFSKMVLETPSASILNEMIHIFRYHFNIKSFTPHRFVHFSDTIVISRNIDNCDPWLLPFHLMDEIKRLAGAQYNCFTEGISIRGSLTAGDFYNDDNCFFGPSLVRGYNLESKEAIFPRIIIDPVLIDWLDSYPVEVAGGLKGELAKYLGVGTDGIHYIDYFAPVLDPDFANSSIPIILSSIRYNILINLHSENDIKIKPKLAWMVEYFNSMLAKLIQNEKMPSDEASKWVINGLDLTSDKIKSNQSYTCSVELDAEEENPNGYCSTTLDRKLDWRGKRIHVVGSLRISREKEGYFIGGKNDNKIGSNYQIGCGFDEVWFNTNRGSTNYQQEPRMIAQNKAILWVRANDGALMVSWPADNGRICAVNLWLINPAWPDEFNLGG